MTNSIRKDPILWRIISYAVVLGLVAALFAATANNFFTSNNVNSILRHMSATGVAALGLTFVIVVNRYDLSFPGIASFGAMSMGMVIVLGYPLWLAIFAGIAVGALFGLVNGIAIGWFNLPDIVTTISVGSIALGMAFFYSNGMTLSDNFFSSGILFINDTKILGLSSPVVVMFFLYVMAGIVLHATRFGRGLYAIGDNANVAHYSGIKVKHLITLSYVICGAMSCWAAVLLSAESGRSDVTAGGGFLMPAYASVFLGAALFGRPSAPATLAGAVLISTILNGCSLLAIPYYYSDAIISMLLLLTIAIFDSRFLVSLRSIFGKSNKITS